jgi:hypothetical protein
MLNPFSQDPQSQGFCTRDAPSSDASRPPSKLVQNFGLLDAVNSGDRIENGIQCSEPQSIVLWNSDAVMSRLFRLEKDVAAFLINSAIAVVFAEQFDQF